jgi:hypothetical protein
VTFSKFAEGLRLVEAGIRLFEDIRWNEQRAAKTGQRLMKMHSFYEEILKEKYSSLSPVISVLDFFK